MKNPLPAIADKLPDNLSQKMFRAGLHLKKQSPHIFFALGTAGVVTSAVMACRATLKLNETMDDIEGDIEAIKEQQNDPRPRNQADDVRDAVYVYAKSAYKLGRLYGPSLAVGVVSIGALTGAHVNLARRNTALMAGYVALQQAFEDYRERVAADLGEPRERDIYLAKQEVPNEEGGVATVSDPGKLSPYAKFFDEGSVSWEKNAEYNRFFLNSQQNYVNDMLKSRGHVFLNEVYARLGLEHTTPGAVVGWVISDDGDNYITFGHDKDEEFMSGREPRVILDFNVDGVIYDKI